MASKVILGIDNVIGRQAGREKKRVQDFMRGFYGPGLEREYITCTHIPFSHPVLQPELTQRSWKICSSFVSRMKAGLANNQAVSETLTLPTLILGDTGFLSGFVLSRRPFTSYILALGLFWHGVLQPWEANLPKKTKNPDSLCKSRPDLEGGIC